MTTSISEQINNLTSAIGLENHQTQALQLLDEGNSRWLRDLKVNLQNNLKEEHLSEKEGYLIALSIAVNGSNEELIKSFADKARSLGSTQEELAEIVACASLLAANNVFYRFRHFAEKESYETMPAKIKMNIMAKPVLGKEFFELVSLAVSAVNGCERCIKAHEQSILELGGTEEKIFEAVRIASVVNSALRVF